MCGEGRWVSGGGWCVSVCAGVRAPYTRVYHPTPKHWETSPNWVQQKKIRGKSYLSETCTAGYTLGCAVAFNSKQRDLHWVGSPLELSASYKRRKAEHRSRGPAKARWNRIWKINRRGQRRRLFKTGEISLRRRNNRSTLYTLV